MTWLSLQTIQSLMWREIWNTLSQWLSWGLRLLEVTLSLKIIERMNATAQRKLLDKRTRVLGERMNQEFQWVCLSKLLRKRWWSLLRSTTRNQRIQSTFTEKMILSHFPAVLRKTHGKRICFALAPKRILLTTKFKLVTQCSIGSGSLFQRTESRRTTVNRFMTRFLITRRFTKRLRKCQMLRLSRLAPTSKFLKTWTGLLGWRMSEPETIWLNAWWPTPNTIPP